MERLPCGEKTIKTRTMKFRKKKEEGVLLSLKSDGRKQYLITDKL